MRAEAAVATGNTWREALDGVVAQLPMLQAVGVGEPSGTIAGATEAHSGAAATEQVDLALLFVHSAFTNDMEAIVAEARRVTGARTLIGCSGQGIIGPGREIEREAAISLQTFSLPGIELWPVRLTDDIVTDRDAAELWSKESNISRYMVTSWLAFAEPYFDTQEMLRFLWAYYPGNPVIGGIASSHLGVEPTFLFLNDEVFTGGAVAVAVGGSYRIRSVVSQGCKPVGEAWTITEVEQNVIKTIGMRPAFDVLVETYRSLPEDMQRRARSNMLVGLAMNEYKDEYTRGDFLVRNLMAIDQENGSIVVNALPRAGQTLQFQLRDPEAADEDLHQLLVAAKEDLGDNQPIGALLCCCNGRGIGLFGEPDHDVRTLTELLGPVPVAGFFCNGEIGPIAGRNFIHGFTASMGIIAKR